MNAPNLPIGPRPPVTLLTKMFYGLGSVAFGIKDNGYRVFLLLFYNQVIGVPAATVVVPVWENRKSTRLNTSH
jgi:GPH family glycoside/pentoside/hexuronide:cation symporter